MLSVLYCKSEQLGREILGLDATLDISSEHAVARAVAVFSGKGWVDSEYLVVFNQKVRIGRSQNGFT